MFCLIGDVMNRSIRSLSLVAGFGISLMALPDVARSQGFYLKGDTGVAFSEDVDVKRFIGAAPGGVKIDLETGGRFTAAGGYNFNDWIGVQVETGFIFNEMDSINGAGNVDGSLSHMPLLVSAVLRYDKPNCPVIPYVGIGMGGDASSIWLDDVRVGGFNVDGSDAELVFAWQAFGGLRYRINQNMSVGAGYKYFYADGAEFDVEDTAADIELGKAQVHSFVVDFTWTF